ncbi:hypothetical protein INT80_03190 [Gallibacterium anatis]|uniref:Uncharacterized protein n=1 Tax=Gallibacterium anatis TaxID=750 RepID=A0A930UU81_9PAST|nr:hypothetical protein [Gallibacterium anatis]
MASGDRSIALGISQPRIKVLIILHKGMTPLVLVHLRVYLVILACPLGVAISLGYPILTW